MTTKLTSLSLLAGIVLLSSCNTAQVDITKTAKGFTDPSRASDIDILMTKPDRHYTELGSVVVTGFDPDQSAEMHNSMRTKAAALGANAVVITNEGIVAKRGVFSETLYLWATGVAIKYN